MQARWIFEASSYLLREASGLFARYPLLWLAACVSFLAAWKLAEIVLWILAMGVRMGIAAALLGAALALYAYVHRG